jgi:phosphatidylethanolamine/phosphatidyl-N-methylethanolamine N-methyltransferase
MKKENKIEEFIHFFEQTIKYPQLTGAVLPSSKNLTKLITEKSNLKNVETIIELGPGSGVFTKSILGKIKKDTTFFVIEINKSFVEKLRDDFSELKIFHDSAENIKKCLKDLNLKTCDRIISGIPWTALDTKTQNKIIEEIYDSLSPNGLFVTFSYFPFNYLPQGKSFKKILEKYFSKVKESEIVSNIPPAFVYVCKK